ncbi:MAG: FG-GAP repeat domain-containing protein [Acidobacteriota bacterium]
MKFLRLFALLCLSAWALWSISRPAEVPFEKLTIDLGASETAAFADINGDGRLDIVSGEYWYQAPAWTPHKFRDIPYTNNYVDNFSDLIVDADGDGRPDIVGCSWFSHRVVWWKNPGQGTGAWKEQIIEDRSPVEFSFLVDIDNDGKAREILPQFGDTKMPLTWYEFKDGRWVGNAVSDRSYGHGIGAGDVNGDGRTDILTPKGWFEAPSDPRAGTWTWHGGFDLGDAGFIHVLDVNGDGRPDLVTSLAHNYGIFWMERGAGGEWTRHLIDDSWSQAHSVVLVDLNGDGRKDLLTGKRYMAHNGHDPGEREPLGVYWYEYRKDEKGQILWVRHVIDYSTRTGGGMQIAAADYDGDGAIDFAVGGKSGLFLFRNLK